MTTITASTNINQTFVDSMLWPITVTGGTSSNIITLTFTENITLNHINQYFICNSNYIQFGSTSLNPDGSRPTITITTSNYNGLIVNGSSGSNGYNNISIYNLFINGSSSNQGAGIGWFGQQYFGKGANNNYIINCASSGDIGMSGGFGGGGILGDYAQNVTLIGCSSLGTIYRNAGGIVGRFAGQSGNEVSCISCRSTGNIASNNNGNGAGGIVGSNSVKVVIKNCYSEGAINGINSGGIIGSNAGSNSALIQNCYSNDVINGANSGGICGSLASNRNVTINNCYSLGSINGSNKAGGICGLVTTSSTTSSTTTSGIITISNCYTVGSTTGGAGFITGNSSIIPSTCFSEAGSPGGSSGVWSNIHANACLTGTQIPVTRQLGKLLMVRQHLMNCLTWAIHLI